MLCFYGLLINFIRAFKCILVFLVLFDLVLQIYKIVGNKLALLESFFFQNQTILIIVKYNQDFVAYFFWLKLVLKCACVLLKETRVVCYFATWMGSHKTTQTTLCPFSSVV
jgi:hypothetical protein